MAKGLFIGITFGVMGAIGMVSYYLSKFKNRSKYIQDEKQINEDFKVNRQFNNFCHIYFNSYNLFKIFLQ